MAHRFLGNLHAQRGATLPLQQEGAGGVVRLRDLALLAKDEVVRAKVGATHALALAQQQQPTAPSVPPPQQQHLAAPRPPSIGYSLLEVCSETRAARLYTALLDPRDSVWEAAARLVWAFEGGPGPGAGGEGSRGVGRQVGQVRRCLRLLRAQALLLWEHLPLALVPRALQQQQQQQQQQAQVPPPAPAPPAALRPCLDEVLLRLAHACGEAEGRLERALAARTAAAAAAAPPLSAKQRDALDFMAVLTEGDGGEGFAAVWRAAEAAQALRGTWPEWERGEVVRECGVKRPDEAVGWLEKQVRVRWASAAGLASVWTPRRGRSPATVRIKCLAAQRHAPQSTSKQPGWCVSTRVRLVGAELLGGIVGRGGTQGRARRRAAGKAPCARGMAPWRRACVCVCTCGAVGRAI